MRIVRSAATRISLRLRRHLKPRAILSLILIGILVEGITTSLPAAHAIEPKPSLKIKSDDTTYYQGDMIKISGNVTDPVEVSKSIPYNGLTVNITLYYNDGSSRFSTLVKILRNGTFNYSFSAKELGSNKVVALYTEHDNNLKAEAQFSVLVSLWNSYQVSVDGKNHQFRYLSPVLLDVEAYSRLAVLDVLLRSNTNGKLTLELPRSLIDAKVLNKTIDSNFNVLLDGVLEIPSNNVKNLKNTASTRTLEISYNFDDPNSKTFIEGTMMHLTTHHLLIVGNRMGGQAATISVNISMDKEKYLSGKDLVTVRGNISHLSSQYPVIISVSIKNSDKTVSLISENEVYTSSSGEFQIDVKRKKDDHESKLAKGEYVVSVKYLGKEAKTTFFVISAAKPPQSIPPETVLPMPAPPQPSKGEESTLGFFRSSSKFLDDDGKEIHKDVLDRISVTRGNAVTIASGILRMNQNGSQLASDGIVFLVQITDENNETVFLSWVNGENTQSFKPSLVFAPEKPGHYSIQIFVWTTLDAPVPLVAKESLRLEVNDTPRLEDLVKA